MNLITYRARVFEANDVFALVNGVPAFALCAFGFFKPGVFGGLCFGAGLGITLYGIAYMYVHDGLVHKRFPTGPLGKLPLIVKSPPGTRIHHTEAFEGRSLGVVSRHSRARGRRGRDRGIKQSCRRRRTQGATRRGDGGQAPNRRSSPKARTFRLKRKLRRASFPTRHREETDKGVHSSILYTAHSRFRTASFFCAQTTTLAFICKNRSFGSGLVASSSSATLPPQDDASRSSHARARRTPPHERAHTIDMSFTVATAATTPPTRAMTPPRATRANASPPSRGARAVVARARPRARATRKRVERRSRRPSSFSRARSRRWRSTRAPRMTRRRISRTRAR